MLKKKRYIIPVISILVLCLIVISDRLFNSYSDYVYDEQGYTEEYYEVLDEADSLVLAAEDKLDDLYYQSVEVERKKDSIIDLLDSSMNHEISKKEQLQEALNQLNRELNYIRTAEDFIMVETYAPDYAGMVDSLQQLVAERDSDIISLQEMVLELTEEIEILKLKNDKLSNYIMFNGPMFHEVSDTTVIEQISSDSIGISVDSDEGDKKWKKKKKKKKN